ncbi:MAG: hypothetical protein IPK28_02755 [Devosia sp.]|nr:hypothetical protein [Devosia sp.]
MKTEHRLRWSHGEATVLANSAMLADCTFTVDSRPFAPFARAPWLGTVDDPTITGHLRVLAGDFVGLPFGSGQGFRNAPPEWAALPGLPAYRSTHGTAADGDWSFVEADDGNVKLSIDYPADSAVVRIEREITPRPDAPALDFVMRIFARRRALTSAGLPELPPARNARPAGTEGGFRVRPHPSRPDRHRRPARIPEPVCRTKG